MFLVCDLHLIVMIIIKKENTCSFFSRRHFINYNLHIRGVVDELYV